MNVRVQKLKDFDADLHKELMDYITKQSERLGQSLKNLQNELAELIQEAQNLESKCEKLSQSISQYKKQQVDVLLGMEEKFSALVYAEQELENMLSALKTKTIALVLRNKACKAKNKASLKKITAAEEDVEFTNKQTAASKKLIAEANEEI